MGFMAGKRALIVGVASDRSIATGIAEAFAREGAEIAFTYQNDKLKSRVLKLAERLGQNPSNCYPCDVSSDDEIDAVFQQLGKDWDGLDILVHSVGFAPRDQLEGGFAEAVTREGFQIAHDISAYSLAGLTKAALPMMQGRQAAMPAWEAALGGERGVDEVTQYVLSLSGRATITELANKGKGKFQIFCVAFHGADGTGNKAVGAPNLTDDIWLYGSSITRIGQSISQGRSGKMPAQGEFLGEAKVHLLSAYVYSLSQQQ